MLQTFVLACLLGPLLLLTGLEDAETPAGAASERIVLWTTGDALMPAWGFYPNAQPYGDTKPLGRWAAWTAAGNEARLTWVAEFPQDATYQVWIRRYGGYGHVAVELNERRVTGGRGGPGGARYVWQHLGTIQLARGQHHVDVVVSHGMLDAVLFTTEAAWSPEGAPLPDPLKAPLLRAPRAYRQDAALGGQAGVGGLVVRQVRTDEEILNDWVPVSDQTADRLRLWGAADQYLTLTLAVRAIQAVDELRVSLASLTGPGQYGLGPERIDLRVVYVRARRTDLFEQSVKLLVPELLLRDDRTGWPPQGRQGGFGGGGCCTRIPAHESRQFWLTVHVPPGSPPGLYRGELTLEVPGANDRRLSLPMELEVLPIDLRPAEGYFSIYYPAQPVNPQQPNYVSPARYLAELEDQARHGLNAVTLYGGFPTLDLARRAGLLKPPCLMHWPDGDATKQVAEARTMGFEDLYYYGVDEPNSPDQVLRCRQEAERRRPQGLHMLTAINSRAAQEATRDWIDRPVYNLYVFGGPDNAAALYARQRGFRPISYWTTATTWPLWFRAMAGLYNLRCGYQGCAPWAYQDFPDRRLYDADQVIHRVSYPDEFGTPISTVGWEAHRAGIDDVRYLEALDRAIAAAETRLAAPGPPARLKTTLETARQSRRRHFESIGGRWFEYLCGLQSGQLDVVRRELAEEEMAIRRTLVETQN